MYSYIIKMSRLNEHEKEREHDICLNERKSDKTVKWERKNNWWVFFNSICMGSGLKWVHKKYGKQNRPQFQGCAHMIKSTCMLHELKKMCVCVCKSVFESSAGTWVCIHHSLLIFCYIWVFSKLATTCTYSRLMAENLKLSLSWTPQKHEPLQSKGFIH